MKAEEAKRRMPTAVQKEVRLFSLRSPPLKEQVVRELTRLIDEGGLSPGEQLPSERELSEQLQVSRGTVREAVQFLQALGLVEIRHGSGTFVSASTRDRQVLRAEWRRWTVRHSDRVRELLEVRRGLESFSAELAAKRQAGDGLEEMVEALEAMENAIGANDVPALVQADVLFHHTIQVAAGNDALVELSDALGAKLLPERAATWDMPGRPQRSLAEHREIYEGIRAGNPKRARDALLAHLASVEHDLARMIGPSGGGVTAEAKHEER